MKICFLIPSMCGGGAEHVIAILSGEMLKRGHEVAILLTSDDTVDYALDDRVVVTQISRRTDGGLTGRLKRLSAIRHYYKSHRDTAYIGMETSTNIFALIAGLGLHMNITISERIDPAKYSSQGFRNAVYGILGRRFVFQTSDARDYFSDKIRDRSVIIFNPIDPGVLTLAQKLHSAKNNAAGTSDPSEGTTGSGRTPVILSAGRLNEQKDYPVLLDAFKQFCDKDDSFGLRIDGKGEDEDALKSYAEKLGISGKVKFMGFARDIWETEHDASMFVLSSHYEGMPNALIEAMALGIPSVSTDCPIGGPAELITDRDNGLLVPIKEPDALCQAMLRLSSDKGFAERLGHNASELGPKLSVESICDQWIEYISLR